MKQPKYNDGVMRFRGASVNAEYGFAVILSGASLINFDEPDLPEDKWLPDPNQRYRIYFGVYDGHRQVAISVRKPGEYSSRDHWDHKCVTSGMFDELWPLFLTYCELMG